MKFKYFLISEFAILQKKYNLSKITNRCKIVEIEKRIKQLQKLTPFLDNNVPISERIFAIKHNMKKYEICNVCNKEIIKPITRKTCSQYCGLKLTHSKIDYKNVSIKAKNTMKIVLNGFSKNELRTIKIKKTFNSDPNIRKKAAAKAADTRIKNNNNSAKIYWDNLSEDQKKCRIKKQNIQSRITNEIRGNWTPLKDKSAYELYFNSSKFTHGFKTNKLNELRLLKTHGIFNKYTNTKGCVRDHLLSRKYGFEHNIPTYIISHPANCEIVLHAENVRRANTNDNLITLDELINKINIMDRNCPKTMFNM